MRYHLFMVVATATVLMLTSGCTTEAPTRWNVVLVLADTLRADHLSLYGYHRKSTPVLETLAESSQLFENHYSQASCTFPSVNSLLTSRPASEFRRVGWDMGIPKTRTTLAEVLKREGYRTAAVSSSPIVRNEPSRRNRAGGFGAGFDIFREGCLWQQANCVFGDAKEILDEFDRDESPFFLYVHFLDPHDPYWPGKRFRRRFAKAPYEGRHDWIRKGDPRPIASMLYSEGPKVEVTESDVERLVDLYDSEIAYLDLYIGRLLEVIDQLDSPNETLLVFLSDHGESFLENGHIKHCRSLDDAEIRVPLVVRVPGRAAERIESISMNVDVMPTILDLLGIDSSELDLVGNALFQEDESREPSGKSGRIGFSAWGRKVGVFDREYKLVRDTETGRDRLFNLQDDMVELDLNEVPAGRLTHLEERLRELLASDPESQRDVEEELRALGYLE